MTFVEEVQRELDEANRGPRMARQMSCLLMLGIVAVFGMFVVVGGILIAKAMGAF